MPRLPYSLSALAAAIAIFVMPATGLAESSFSADEREEIGEIIRDYLLENPSLLEEVIEELERQQAEAEVAAQEQVIFESREEIFDSPDSFVAGNPEGDVTLVEFFDYNCQYCRRMMPVVMELIENDPDLRVVLKDWPVLGEGSAEAAQVGTAVKRAFPDDYLEFHTRLLSEQGQVDGDRALEVAEEIGISRTDLENTMEDPQVSAILRRSGQLGGRLGLRGTPSYVLGDQIIGGAVGRETLESEITDVRENGCAAC